MEECHVANFGQIPHPNAMCIFQIKKKASKQYILCVVVQMFSLKNDLIFHVPSTVFCFPQVTAEAQPVLACKDRRDSIMPYRIVFEGGARKKRFRLRRSSYRKKTITNKNDHLSHDRADNDNGSVANGVLPQCAAQLISIIFP